MPPPGSVSDVATGGRTFDDITERLDEIVTAVRSKDTSLERSLDLFDEAIKLGSEAVDMVDRFELSPREADLLDASEREAAEGAASSRGPEAASEAGVGQPEAPASAPAPEPSGPDSPSDPQ